MRTALLFGFLTLVSSVAVPAETTPVQGIEISADVPTVTIGPRRAGRFALRLPSLTYSLTLTTYCAQNWQPASLSINIADSRESFDADQLQDSEELRLEIRIPSNQIAPLRIERFCIDDEQADAADNDEITVSAALSAQASLLCVAESEQSMTYVTQPLDVTLECAVPDPAVDRLN